MVQASDEQSREANDETREHIGRFWCHERKDFFPWKEFIEYYKYNK